MAWSVARSVAFFYGETNKNGSKQVIKRDKNGRFVKNAIANPNGRPKKGQTMTDLCREYIEEKIKDEDGKTLIIKKAFIKKVFDRAIKDGDTTAMKLIWNYLDGMPKQVVEVGSGKLDEIIEEMRKL